MRTQCKPALNENALPHSIRGANRVTRPLIREPRRCSACLCGGFLWKACGDYVGLARGQRSRREAWINIAPYSTKPRR